MITIPYFCLAFLCGRVGWALFRAAQACDGIIYHCYPLVVLIICACGTFLYLICVSVTTLRIITCRDRDHF